MSAMEIIKSVLFVYLTIGGGLGAQNLAAILLASDYLHKVDGVQKPSFVDALFIFFYSMFFWGWAPFQPHWERLWRIY